MNKRWVWVLVLCALLGYLVYAGAIHKEDVLAKDVLRMHILSNSNSKEDQRIKLCVRDSVLKYIELNAGDTKRKQDVSAWVQAHLADIEEVAEQVVRQEGAGYGAKAELGTFAFPIKTYGDTTYPAGMYDALKVNLGAARGDNWWCVIFPPLCLADLGGTMESTAAETEIERTVKTQHQTAVQKTTATPQATAAPEGTAAPPSTATSKATAAPQPTATPKATATPQENQEVIGGVDSYAYLNGLIIESLFMEWLFG